MATNPMQRKARNSFLLGMLIMLLICGIIIALLFMQLMNNNKKEQEKFGKSVDVYALNQDVSSGQVITSDMLVKQTVAEKVVPRNATSDLSVIENYALQDKEGNEIYTKAKNGEAKLYVRKKDNTEYEIQQEEETDNYYITKSGNKEYIELNTIPLVAKVNMKKNTIITTEFLNKSDSLVQDDVRKQQYNMIILPMDLVTGEYVDIRFMLPSGQDYIVVSKKEVEIPKVGGVDSEDTVWLNLTEDEILNMSCAIVEAFQIPGSKLYATKYTEPGMQDAATPTYPLNESTIALLRNNPNVLEKAMNAIATRYNNNNASELRNNHINNAISAQGDQAKTNLETKMQESTSNSKTDRKEYLDALSGAAE
ncbi:MAG: hypothetical protein HFJ36_04095 [Clostridia bacterium]|nr:hypothetical protein [Clostridia bacterium]